MKYLKCGDRIKKEKSKQILEATNSERMRNEWNVLFMLEMFGGQTIILILLSRCRALCWLLYDFLFNFWMLQILISNTHTICCRMTGRFSVSFSTSIDFCNVLHRVKQIMKYFQFHITQSLQTDGYKFAKLSSGQRKN